MDIGYLPQALLAPLCENRIKGLEDFTPVPRVTKALILSIRFFMPQHR